MFTLRCFGSVSILRAERELVLRSRKHSGLLLYVCAHPKTVHTRTDLATLLWDASGARERHSLSQALYDIKSKVGSVLETSAMSVRLGADLIEYEAREFENAVERGDHRAALDRYRGEFAPTLSNLGAQAFDRWLDGERDRYRVLGGIALRSSLRNAEMRADWDGVCLSALRLIRMNDFDERAHRALMRGLWLKGDGISAIEHYRGLKSRLSSEVPDGLAPATIQLAAKIGEDEAGHSKQADSTSGLIGRPAEFSEMREAYDDVRAGGTAAVIVLGEQGIGKTRLLTEFARYIEGRGACLVRSVATSLTRERAYGTVLDLMTAAGIGLEDEDLEPEAAHAPAAFLRVKREFEGGVRALSLKKPVALIVDDAEFMDAESAEVLASCQARLARFPLLLVIAVDSASPRESAIRSLEASLRRRDKTRVLELTQLDAESLRTILEGSVRDARESAVDPAIALAGGNPLYATELLRCFDRAQGHGPGMEHAPPTETQTYLATGEAQQLHALIRGRIGALSKPARAVLTHLAILGEGVDEGLFREIVQVEEPHDTLRELERNGLVELAEDRWKLRHGVIRHFVTRELGHTRQAAIHLAAATVLNRRGDADPLLLAEHYANGGEREAAYGHAMRAAEGTLASAPAAAVAAASLAANQAVTVHDRSRARLLEAHSELERGHYLQAESILLSLVGASDLSANAVPEINAALAEAKLNLCEWEAAEHELRKAKAKLEDAFEGSSGTPVQLRVTALELRLAHAEGDRFRMQSAARTLSHLLRSLDLHSSAAQLAWFMGWVELLKYSLWCESLSAAFGVFSAHAHALPRLSQQLRARALSAKAILAIRQGRLDEGVAIYSDLTENSQHDPPHLRASLLNNLAVVRLEQGIFGEAAKLLDECIKVDQAMSAVAPHAVFAIMNRGACAMYRGVSAEANKYYGRAAELCESGGLRGLSDETTACLGLLALERGAMSIGEAHAETLKSGPSYHRWEEERFKAAWLRGFLLARSRPDEASEYLLQTSEVEAGFDVLSCHKLRFLAALARTRDAGAADMLQVLPQHPARRELVHIGLGWFARTAVTWWDRARAASSERTC
jgi:DNA-binding SARP family transcriptional activator/tetratricopeptide (TPR) repeat protein